MKRAQLIKEIAKRAREVDKVFAFVRPGKRHEIWGCGETQVPIPRHKELGEGLVDKIHKELEAELGEDWWRR